MILVTELSVDNRKWKNNDKIQSKKKKKEKREKNVWQVSDETINRN